MWKTSGADGALTSGTSTGGGGLSLDDALTGVDSADAAGVDKGAAIGGLGLSSADDALAGVDGAFAAGVRQGAAALHFLVISTCPALYSKTRGIPVPSKALGYFSFKYLFTSASILSHSLETMVFFFVLHHAFTTGSMVCAVAFTNHIGSKKRDRRFFAAMSSIIVERPRSERSRLRSCENYTNW